MSLQFEIDALRLLSHELLHLGLDGEPIYTDRFRALNAEVYRQSELLFPKNGNTPEEEAALCVALLMGYSATIYNDGDKEKRVQEILNRSWTTLDRLSTSLLKCELLVTCYAELLDGALAQEAHMIISNWTEDELVEDKKEVMELLTSLEENRHFNSEINKI